MIINNNISALNTFRQMGSNNAAGAKSMEKLSSGLRINKAGDDAAGLAISEKMRAQVRGLDQAQRNSQDGISMIQTAEGSLQETHNILQRMRELATQAANDTNVEVDRNEIQKEMNALTSEINRIGNTTEFNTQKLLNGGGDAVGQVTATSTPVAPGADPAIQGHIDFTIDTRLAATETIVVGGQTITSYADATALADADDAFGVHADQTADEQAAAIRGMSFTGLTATGEGANVILTQTAAGTGNVDSATGTTAAFTENSQVDGAAGDPSTPGRSEFTITTALAAGETLEVGGETITSYADAAARDAANAGAGDAFGVLATDDAATQAGAIRGMSFADLTATGAGANVILTQDAAGTGNIAAATVAGASGSGTGFSATFQIGANGGQSMTIDVRDMRATSDSLKVASEDGTTVTAKSGKVASYTVATDVTNGTNNEGQFKSLDVSSHEKATAAIDVINDAIESVSAERSKLGAFQNRLEHTISNLGNASENLSAAESRIRDVDMAKEVMEMTRANILGQASQAMLAQANQKPQSVLQLLG